ncbi:MAG: hypothetical protein ACLVK8_02735 [Ruminococcus sp.]
MANAALEEGLLVLTAKTKVRLPAAPITDEEIERALPSGGRSVEIKHCQSPLAALHAICLQIFRHIAEILATAAVCLRNFCAICRKI